jgi:hypothetical protein
MTKSTPRNIPHNRDLLGRAQPDMFELSHEERVVAQTKAVECLGLT